MEGLPPFLYGTAWKSERTEALTLMALEAGFRGIDTANQRKHYHEAGVGAALARAFDSGLVARDDLFLQTKFTHRSGQDHRLPYDPKAPIGDQVRQSFASSLEHLGVDRLECLVLHGPSRRDVLADVDWQAWRAMEALHGEGSVRYLGVSNVAPRQLAELCHAATVRPRFVQNRCYAQLGWDAPVRAVAAEHGVVYQGFSLLTANRHVWVNPEIAAIAKRLSATPAQVIFRFALDLGVMPLTGTSHPAHMAADLVATSIVLTPADRARLVHVGGRASAS